MQAGKGLRFATAKCEECYRSHRMTYAHNRQVFLEKFHR